jgi:hypothetical protein
MDRLLSHVDARRQFVAVEFHDRGSINIEPIPVIMSHLCRLRAQVFCIEESASGIQANKHPVAES